MTKPKTADLTRRKAGGGFVSGLDVANSDAIVADTASRIPSLEAAAQLRGDRFESRDQEPIIASKRRVGAGPAVGLGGYRAGDRRHHARDGGNRKAANDHSCPGSGH